MKQALSQWISWIASKHALSEVLQQYEPQMLTGMLLLAIACCFAGFYCYRGVTSALACLVAATIAGAWIRPVWGASYAAAVCAVLGVIFGFLIFRWFRVGAVTLAALIAGGLVWQSTGNWPVLLSVSTAVALALTAGVFTLAFPFWGVCGCTAIWGGTVIAAQSIWYLGLTAAAAGFCLQLFLFRKQKLLPRIRSTQSEYHLPKKKAPRR